MSLIGKPPPEQLQNQVRHQKNCQENPICNDALADFIRSEGKEASEDDDVVVQRGQWSTESIRTRVPWFSTSVNVEVSKDFLGKNSCCLFKIHLMPGTHYLDVNRALKNLKQSGRNMYSQEKEQLVIGGGTFQQDTNGTPGFRKLSPGFFETWYSEQPVKPKAVAKAPAAAVAETTVAPAEVPVTLTTLKQRAAEEGFENEEDEDFLIKLYKAPYEKYVKEGGRRAGHKTRGRGRGRRRGKSRRRRAAKN